MSDREANPARIAADADVLAADLLIDGPARESLGHIRRHSWLALVASDRVIADAEAIIEELTDSELASDWRTLVEDLRVPVEHEAGDHPALASAYHGNAAHLLSYDERLTSPDANLTIQSRVALSIRPPDAFARLFDPKSLYESLHDDPYPGPDREE